MKFPLVSVIVDFEKIVCVWGVIPVPSSSLVLRALASSHDAPVYVWRGLIHFSRPSRIWAGQCQAPGPSFHSPQASVHERSRIQRDADDKSLTALNVLAGLCATSFFRVQHVGFMKKKRLLIPSSLSSLLSSPKLEIPPRI